MFDRVINTALPLKTKAPQSYVQKQPSKSVLSKRCPENMQQEISRKTPMPKCDFNKVALQLGGCFYMLTNPVKDKQF